MLQLQFRLPIYKRATVSPEQSHCVTELNIVLKAAEGQKWCTQK